MLFLQLLATGIQTGALYALTAAGFALIFGATGISHGAHGATFALAGYVFAACVNGGLGWPIGCGLAAIVAVGFGLGMELLVYRPIQRHEASFFTVFVAALGAVIVVQSFIEIVFGRGFTSVTTSMTRAVEVVPGFFLAPVFAVVIIAAILMFGSVILFLERTQTGLGLRALSENTEQLRAYGLSSRRLSTIAFALGSLLTVPAAVLTAATSGLGSSIGAHVMLISLAASVVGGIGNLRGAACAGLLLGVTESLVVSFLDTQWSEAAGFVLLFAFILFRPNGLFGRSASAK
jgi:branched-chain amino acid transport system permease protein